MKKPRQLDPLAQKLLDRLVGRTEAGEIVLGGGYFALKHYLDYRQTHDIDAWWKTRATAETETIIEQAMRELSRDEGLEFVRRTFGDTASFELIRDRRRVFSFQIAVRSVELEPPLVSPWPPILLETLADNIGAKMNALVDRGSPRDFVDIKRLVDAGLTDSRHCWELWQRKNSGGDLYPARQKVRLHLVALEARRPLTIISDPQQQSEARATREWFRDVFLK